MARLPTLHRPTSVARLNDISPSSDSVQFVASKIPKVLCKPDAVA